MGIAVLSGVLASLESTTRRANGIHIEKWDSHTPGTVTPTGTPDASVPHRFIATVHRRTSVKPLEAVFAEQGILGQSVEVMAGPGKNVEAVNKSDVVLLCCKPQLAQGILKEAGMQEALQGKLLISILAGVTLTQLEDMTPESTRVVRAMPNTPCKIREGMTVVSILPHTPETDTDEAIILKIFSSIGRCRFLDEKYFDACTALGGSGPAFACMFLEAMADGGVMMGLPRQEALELAAQTLQGAARMVLSTGKHPAQIKDSVTTPGGCTIAGLLALEEGKLRSTVARGIQVATERASELGQVKK